MFDLLIKGGRVVDGTGAATRTADGGIVGGRLTVALPNCAPLPLMLPSLVITVWSLVEMQMDLVVD